MNTWKCLLLSAAAIICLSSCSSGEYQVTTGQGEEHQPYREWNWLPKNS